jgi:hypothetical protein
MDISTSAKFRKAGKVRMEDGEAAVGVRVELYREYRLKGVSSIL